MFDRDALTKMRDVYMKNPHMGDPSSVDSRLEEVTQNIDKLQLDARKYEVTWLPHSQHCDPSLTGLSSTTI